MLPRAQNVRTIASETTRAGCGVTEIAIGMITSANSLSFLQFPAKDTMLSYVQNVLTKTLENIGQWWCQCEEFKQEE